MNGIIWQAIFNVVNSFTMQEMESMTIPTMGLRTGTHAALDIFIERVNILEDTVLSIQKEDRFYSTDQTAFEKEKVELKRAHLKYRAILRFLHRTGHIRFKPPRDFADD